jgi:hypothetical protein
MSGIQAQFRVRLVSDPTLVPYGHAGAFVIRDQAVVRLNLAKLSGDLQILYGFSLADSRYLHVHRMVLAHEMSHRFTLRHPIVTVSVAPGFTTTGAALPRGVDAQVFADIDNVTRQSVDAQGRTTTKVLRPVKVRLVAEERVVPRDPLPFVFPLQEPVDIRFPLLPGSPPIPFLGGFDRHSRRLAAVVVDRAPIWVAGPESLTRRTGHYILDGDPNSTQDAEIAAGRAEIRFREITLTPPPVQGDDWTVSGGGPFFFPAITVPDPRLRLMQMILDRPFKKEHEEE